MQKSDMKLTKDNTKIEFPSKVVIKCDCDSITVLEQILKNQEITERLKKLIEELSDSRKSPFCDEYDCQGIAVRELQKIIGK